MSRIIYDGCVPTCCMSYYSTELCTQSEYCNAATIKYYPDIILCNVMKTSSYDSFKVF